MGILGLTHDDHGSALQRLPVAIKLAIGRGPDETKGRKHPERLDHFIFCTRNKRGSDVVWDEDAGITEQLKKLYGENPREVEIVFLDDQIDNIFRTSLAWWKATECYCRGDIVQIEGNFAMQAIRRTEKHPEGEPWPGPYKYSAGEKKGQPVEPCGDGCPDIERGDCKPSADAYFVFAKLPMLGAVCRLHTTSYRSIRNIHAGLQQIRTITGGRLAGIPIRLKVDPEKISYEDRDGKKKNSTAHILSLVFTAEDMQKLIGGAREHAQLFEQGRKYLGSGRVEIVEDEEPARALDIAPEFYHQEEDEQNGEGHGRAGMAPPKAFIPPPEEVADRAQIHKLCEAKGINYAGEMSLLGQFKGRLGELVTKLESEEKSAGATEQREAVSDRTASQPQTSGTGPKIQTAKKQAPPPPEPKQAPAAPYLDF